MSDSVKVGKNPNNIVVARGRNFKSYRNDNYEQDKQELSSEEKKNIEEIIDSVFRMRPSEFKGLHLQNIVTSNDLMQLINSSFGNIFLDYYGGRIFPNPRDPREIITEIFFTPKPEYINEEGGKKVQLPNNMILALSQIGGGEKDEKKETTSNGKIPLKPIVRRLSTKSNAISGYKYEFTEAAKIAFTPFINKKFWGKKLDKHNNPTINWRQIITETSIAPVIGRDPMLVYTFPIDIVAFAREYWGDKNKDGHPVDYDVALFNPFPNYYNNPAFMSPETANWMFQITQVDKDVVFQIGQNLGGFNTNQNGIIPFKR